MIGRGVFAKYDIPRGSFLFEYKGELIDKKEAEIREEMYEQEEKGCYMMYFVHKKQLCIDATDEKYGVARLVNHRKEPNNNVFARKIMIDGEPRLCMFNCCLIKAGEELRHDYGDRSRKTIDENPWLEE
jgi:SET domain-containing protein